MSVTDLLDTPRELNNAATMDQYGITSTEVKYYHYGGFRYSSLHDAVAQAKRMISNEPPEEK